MIGPSATIAAVVAPATAAAVTVPTHASAAAKNPVIVVAGLTGVASGYEPLANRLRADGYRVFIYRLPGLDFGDIRDSARAFGVLVQGYYPFRVVGTSAWSLTAPPTASCRTR